MLILVAYDVSTETGEGRRRLRRVAKICQRSSRVSPAQLGGRDYDLSLVVPDDATLERILSRLAYEVLWGTGIAADVFVWTRSLFDRRRHVVTSLPATVMREGKLLYGA